MSNRLLVLGWHNIDPTPGFPAPPGVGRLGLANERPTPAPAGVGRLGFAKQLRTLARFATVLPLQDALRRMEAGEPLPARAVVLTFDHGYLDNLELGVPMLAGHRITAIVL